MESRIKQLREKRGLIQEILAAELGITQQMLSKYERDVTLIKVDILKKIATYFNVTTDYLLGVSDVKRDLQRQMKMNETLDEYYDLIATVYKGNIIKNLIMDCQSYTKYRPNETTGGIFVSWRRKEELPTEA